MNNHIGRIKRQQNIEKYYPHIKNFMKLHGNEIGLFVKVLNNLVGGVIKTEEDFINFLASQKERSPRYTQEYIDAIKQAINLSDFLSI